MVIAANAHLDAAVPEPCELVLQLREAGVGDGRRDGDFELCAAPGAEGVLGDRLRGVRSEPARALDVAARLTRRYDARPDERRGDRPRRESLRLAPSAREGLYRVEQVAVRPEGVDRGLRDRDAELALESERELEKIQRVRGEVVDQRDVRGELLGVHAELVGDHPSNARLHKVEHAQPPSHDARTVHIRFLCAVLHKQDAGGRSVFSSYGESGGVLPRIGMSGIPQRRGEGKKVRVNRKRACRIVFHNRYLAHCVDG